MNGNVKKVDKKEEKHIHNAINNFIESIRNDKETYETLLKSIEAKKEKLDHFITPPKTKTKLNELIVLRRWNSNSPLLGGHQNPSNKGGGYYLSYNNYGIVIDPGYNFIENFALVGYKLDDIDAIYITHAHDDHTAQLEGILSLLYKRSKKKDVANKKIDLYMNLGSFKKFSNILNLTKDSVSLINKVVLLNAHQIITVNDDIELFTTRAKHDETITSDYALGFTFCFSNSIGNKRIVKFTGDTAWSCKNEDDNYNKSSENGIDHIDILVCHLGSVTNTELLEYDIEMNLEANEKSLYPNHLGLIGTMAEIDKWAPQITLVSEFGLELMDLRTDLMNRINEHLNKKVFPVDINFRVNIDSLEVMSHKSNKYYDANNLSFSENNNNCIVYYNKELDFEDHEKGNIDSAVGIISNL